MINNVRLIQIPEGLEKSSALIVSIIDLHCPLFKGFIEGLLSVFKEFAKGLLNINRMV